MDQQEIFEALKIFATPVLQRDLNSELRTLDEKDGETVVGYYLPEDQQYIHE